MSSDSRGEGWGVADCVHTTWRVCIQMSLLLCRHAAWMGFLLSFMGWGGVSPSQRPRPGGCPSCLLRMAIRMEKRGSEPGGQDVWGSWDVFRGGLTGERRNVHESFWVYCTFSIILRNSGNDRQTKHLTSVKDIGTVLNYGSIIVTRTVKVQHAIGVLVSILQQLINLILCDALASATDDDGELLSVDVTVTVPVQ